MRCKTVLTRIDALRTGELRGGEGNAVKGHVRRCPSCEESLVDLDHFAAAARRLAVKPPRSFVKAVREELSDCFDRVESGGGQVWVAFADGGVRMISTVRSADEFRRAYAARFGRDLREAPLPGRYRKQVVRALEGRGAGEPLVDLAGLTEFEREVLQVIARIPKGEVRTYSWVARIAGRPKAVRAVGNVAARNPVPLLLPCHRVVPASGGVGSYALGSAMKRTLLEREGCSVRELDELAARQIRYFGSETTHVFCVPTCRDARRIARENRVAFRDEKEAKKKGFRPCQHCRPAA